MWVEILTFVFLGICAVSDGVEKKIPLAVVWLGMTAAFVLRVMGLAGNGTWQSAVISLMPGMLFWLLSYISGEKVGYGDGWLLVMIGLFMGLWKCFLILIAGLLFASLTALVLLAVKRIVREDSLPFAPFLLLGLGVAVCL